MPGPFRFKPQNLIFAFAAATSVAAANSFAAHAGSKPVDRTQFLPTVLVNWRGPGEVYVGNHRTSPEHLITDVETESGHAGPHGVRILVQVAKTVPYEEFTTYLKILQNAGYDKIGMISVGLINEKFD